MAFIFFNNNYENTIEKNRLKSAVCPLASGEGIKRFIEDLKIQFIWKILLSEKL